MALGNLPTQVGDASMLGAVDGRVTRPDGVQPSRSTADVTRIGRFLLLRVLGAGAMGRVHAAYDEKLDRRVAIKVLHRGVDGGARERALREAKAMAKLSHPNVVQVYEVEEHEGKLCIAMELVEGETLERWQAQPGRSGAQILAAYRQAGEGLAAAHAVGLIHRDFKPQNAMVQPLEDGGVRVRVLDFGIAQLAAGGGPPSEPAELLVSEGVDTKLTATGSLLGTPAYMAPEQFMGSNVDAAADQFAFCVALWEGLFGGRPFGGDSLPELMASITSEAPREPSRRGDVPSSVARALRRGLAVNASDRYPSMRSLLDALSFDPARRWRRAGAALAALVVLGSGGLGVNAWLEDRAKRCSGAATQLEQAWGSARRDEIQRQMLRTGVSYAQDAWLRVATVLELYTADWAAMHAETCEATTVRGEQSIAVMDLRMACLGRARQGLHAISDVLADADLEVVEHVDDLLGGLEPLERCADLEALRSDVPPPPPHEADEVAAIRAVLAEARAEYWAGRYEAAGQRIEDAQRRASGVGYEPIQTEVDLGAAQVLYQQGHYDQAERALRDALRRASVHHQWSQMQHAATKLIQVLGTGEVRPAEALRYRDVAEGLAEGDPRRQAEVSQAVAGALFAQGDYASAEQELRRAIALVSDDGWQDDALVDLLHNDLASALRERGEFAAAEAENRRVLARRRDRLGSQHPAVANSMYNLSMALQSQGRYEEAESELRAVLQIRQSIAGLSLATLGDTHMALASLLVRRGAYDEAEEHLRETMALQDGVLRPDHPARAMPWNNLAVVDYWRGDYVQAESKYRRAKALLEAAHGAEHPQLIAARNNLAGVLEAQGKLDVAEQEYREALALARRLLGDDHPDVDMARSNLAANLAGQHRYAEAEPEYREARITAGAPGLGPSGRGQDAPRAGREPAEPRASSRRAGPGGGRVGPAAARRHCPGGGSLRRAHARIGPVGGRRGGRAR